MTKNFFTYLANTPISSEILPGSDGLTKCIPAADYVVFRDEEGTSTAIYGDDSWDPNPARLSAKKNALWRFDKIFHGNIRDLAQSDIISDLKYIVFCLTKFSTRGHIGQLSITTISTYFTIFKLASRFCYAQTDHPFIGRLSITQLFSNPSYLGRFANTLRGDSRSQGLLVAVLLNLSQIPPNILGFKPVTDLSVLKLDDKPKKKQHPVIPTGLYLKLINILENELDHYDKYLPDLERFVSAFSNRRYGSSLNYQERALKLPPTQQFKDFTQAVELHSLKDFFVGEYACKFRQNLSMILSKIQYIVKLTIHAYTGMRDQEVARLPYDCLRNVEIAPAIPDEKQRRAPEIIDLISTTTKYTGYQSGESWLAPTEVIRAVRVAQAICRGLANIYCVRPEQMPLFASPSVIKLKNKKLEVTVWMQENKPFRLNELVIQSSHLDELQLSDPEREFKACDGFALGASWPLTSHQLRRSLAYYGSSSGFVTLPTLSKQFKHLARQMTKFYNNNFEQIKSIFGYYDPKINNYTIPNNHFIFNFQLAVPMNAAYELISAVLSETEFIGGTGVQINKQRERLSAGEIIISDLRSETQKRVSAGEIAYRKTFLGACTKVGDCQEYMLGNVLPCTTCDGSVIHPDSLRAHIQSLEEERAQYANESGEYQVLNYEISTLKAFATKRSKK